MGEPGRTARLQPEWCNQAHTLACAGTAQLKHAVRLIAAAGHLAGWQPAADHQHHLARSVRHRLLTHAQSLTNLRGRSGDAQHRQRPRPLRPRGRDDQRQDDASHAARRRRALLAGGAWVAAMPIYANTAAPVLLQRFIDNEREFPANRDQGLR
jgi:hypothetical protein